MVTKSSGTFSINTCDGCLLRRFCCVPRILFTKVDLSGESEKVLRVSMEQELKRCLHGFLASKSCARQVLQNRLAPFLKKLPSSN